MRLLSPNLSSHSSTNQSTTRKLGTMHFVLKQEKKKENIEKGFVLVHTPEATSK
jgi:hypothetical protein